MAQEDATATLTPVINAKKKRNLPGNPDPGAEVIALSPKTLMTTNRFVCEVCGKGFPRDQNLQLHRRGHNLPWKLKQRNGKEVRKRVYVCPEKTCVHHHPSRALGDLTGIKKHFCRKHGDKKWKCEKCSKKYAVQSDWKAHSKTCGTREYRCDCGTVFSRRDSFITHRAFCDALAEETARINAASHFNMAAAAAAANGSLNYSFMGGVPLLPGGLMAPQQHFSNLFKPFPTTKDEHETRVNNIDHQIQKGNSLPLWIMGQDPTTLINHNSTGNNVLHQADINQQIGLSSINQAFYTSPQSVVSCSDHAQQEASNSYSQMNWFLGDTNKMCPTSGEEALTCTNSLPLMSTHDTTTVRGELVASVSVPSIYSNQHQASSSAPHMSATALLQKAAQFGATATDPVFLGSLKHTENNIISEAQELGGYGSNSTTTNLVGSDVESTENVFSPMSSNNNNQVDMFPAAAAAKRRRVMQQDHYHHHYHHNEAEDGGQTRDFLGVGVESICHPSPIGGWI